MRRDERRGTWTPPALAVAAITTLPISNPEYTAEACAAWQ